MGSNGTELTKLLASQGVRVRVMVRSSNAAKLIATLAGVEIVIGNFDDSASTPCSGSKRRSSLPILRNRRKLGNSLSWILLAAPD
jgi:hypothetical protein